PIHVAIGLHRNRFRTLLVVQCQRHLHAIIWGSPSERHLARDGGDLSVPFCFDNRPQGAKWSQFDQRRTLGKGRHGRSRAGSLLYFVPRPSVGEYTDLCQRLTVGAGSVKEHSHRGHDIVDMEVRLAQLVGAALIRECSFGREHDGDDVLNSKGLVTSHSDSFGGIPHFLWNTWACDFTRNLASTAVLTEHAIHRRDIASRRAHQSRLLRSAGCRNE